MINDDEITKIRHMLEPYGKVKSVYCHDSMNGRAVAGVVTKIQSIGHIQITANTEMGALVLLNAKIRDVVKYLKPTKK